MRSRRRTRPTAAIEVATQRCGAAYTLDRPQRGLDCAARELLGMGQKIEQMLITVEPLYDHWDAAGGKLIRDQDMIIKKMHLRKV